VRLTEADIAGARRHLECALESFVACDFDGSSAGNLQKATGMFEEIHARARQEAPPSCLAPAVQDLKMQATRLAQLAESAAAFYRGWFGAAPTLEGYTGEGIWAASQGSAPVGGLSLEA
jgi:hypothetical protein